MRENERERGRTRERVREKGRVFVLCRVVEGAQFKLRLEKAPFLMETQQT